MSQVAAVMRRLALVALLAPLALGDPATEQRLLAAAVADLYAALDGAAVTCEALETAYRHATGCRQDAVAMSRHQCWVARALAERSAHGGVPRQLRESVERLEILRAEPGCPPPDP